MRRPSLKILSLEDALCANIPVTAQLPVAIRIEKPPSGPALLPFNQTLNSSCVNESRRRIYPNLQLGDPIISLYGWMNAMIFSISNQNFLFKTLSSKMFIRCFAVPVKFILKLLSRTFIGVQNSLLNHPSFTYNQSMNKISSP